MQQFFLHNGKFIKVGTPTILINNRGVRYGDGFFDTLKVVNGKIILENLHFERLLSSFKLLKFSVPKLFTFNIWQQQILQLVKKNNCLKMARVRVMCLRNEGGLYDAINHQPQIIIESQPLLETTTAFLQNGLTVGFFDDIKIAPSFLTAIKTNNYLPYMLGALHAKENKWNDCIMLNTTNQITDTTIANIFIVKKSKIYTPPIQQGCVDGIMRKFILEKCKYWNIKLSEKKIDKNDVLNADEVFVTNSIYDVRWVKQIDDVTYANNLAASIFNLVTKELY